MATAGTFVVGMKSECSVKASMILGSDCWACNAKSRHWYQYKWYVFQGHLLHVEIILCMAIKLSLCLSYKSMTSCLVDRIVPSSSPQWARLRHSPTQVVIDMDACMVCPVSTRGCNSAPSTYRITSVVPHPFALHKHVHLYSRSR